MSAELLVSLASMLTNGLVLVAILRSTARTTTTCCLLASLAAADFMVSLPSHDHRKYIHGDQRHGTICHPAHHVLPARFPRCG